MILKTDKELIELLIKRKMSPDKVFSYLFQKYEDKTYAFCRSITINENDAKEIFQEGWLKFWENLKYKNKIYQPVKSYIFKILHDKLVDCKRRKCILDVSFIDEIENFDFNSDVNIEEEIMSKDITEQVLKILNKFPDSNGEVVRLYLIDDLSFDEISKILSLSVSNVKARFYRTKKQLRNEFKKLKLI